MFGSRFREKNSRAEELREAYRRRIWEVLQAPREDSIAPEILVSPPNEVRELAIPGAPC